MINVSDKFKEKMADTTLFSQHAEVTFTNGETITLGADEFVVGDNYFTDGSGMNSIPLGEAVCRGITMTIDNDDDWLEPYDWTYAKIRLWLEFVLETDSEESAVLGEMVLGKAVLGSDGATLVEKIELGTFTCLEPETYGETVTVDAVDDMYKADVDYEPQIAFPATLEAMFLDICSQCDIPFQTLEFQNHSFQVQSLPEGDYTCREMLGYIAMIACGNCRISRNGFCEILTYDFTQEKHDLGYFISLTIGQGDITITGIQTTIEEQDSEGHTTETPVVYGEEGYMLSIENPLIATQEAVALPMIGQFIVGQTFRKFSGNHTAYPLAEFMDLCTFTDWKGNTYTSFITDITFNFYGQTYFENSAEDGLRMQSKYSNSGTRAIIKAQQYIRTEANARLAMQEAFEKMIANASGMYLTEEEQPDGSIIYYLHDKPTLEESTNIIKITSEGIGFSPDGGETYPYGMTITGDMVMQIIAAEGILADWVQVGASTTLTEELTILENSIDETVVNIIRYNALGTSNTEPPDGATYDGATLGTFILGTGKLGLANCTDWTTDAQYPGDGQYLWIKDKYIHSDGSETWGNPVCVEDGSTLMQITNMEYQFSVMEGQMLSYQARTDEVVTTLGETITTQYSYILQTIDSINISVGEKVSTGDMVTYVGSEIEVLKDSISLTVSGELGQTAGIQIAVGDKALDGSIDMTKVREAFANDDSSIVIAAGTILFESGTLIIDSDYFKVSATGVVTATSGTIGGWTLSSTAIYNQTGLYEAGISAPATISSTTNAFYVGTRTSSSSSSWSYPFYVTYGGLVHAENAEVTGKFTTESGQYKAVLSSGRLSFYYNDYSVGSFMSSCWSSGGVTYSDTRGIALNGEYGDNGLQFIAFGKKNSEEAETYTAAYYISYNTTTISGYRHNFSGSTHFTDYVDFSGNVNVYGWTVLNSTTEQYGQFWAYNGLYVYGNSSFNSDMNVYAALTFGNNYGIRVTYPTGQAYYVLYADPNGVVVFGNSDCIVDIYGSRIYMLNPVTIESTLEVYYQASFWRSAVFANGYGITLCNTSSVAIYALFMGDDDCIYVGDASYVTYLRGSTIYARGGNFVVGRSSDTDERRVNIINSTGQLIVAINPNNKYMGLYNYTASCWFCYSSTGGATYLGNSSYYTYLYGYYIYVNGTIASAVTISGRLNMYSSIIIANNTTLASVTAGGTPGVSTAYRLIAMSSNNNIIVGTNGDDGFPLYLYGSTIYANNVSISSDARLKTDIEPMTNIALLDYLQPITYKFICHPEKTHMGFTVQDVEAALSLAGIDPETYGITAWGIDEDTKQETGYLAYDEIIPLLVLGYQKMKAELESLKGAQ